MGRHSFGWEKKLYFPYLLPLTILFNTAIEVCARILVHPILVNAKEHVIGGCEVISREVTLSH